VRCFEQIARVRVAAQHVHPCGLPGGEGIEVPALAAGDHIGVHLQQYRQLRVLVQRRFQHACEAGRIGCAIADRRVAEGLVDDQHVRAFQGRRRFSRMVVLGQAPGTPPLAQRGGASTLVLAVLAGNERLDARRPRGVVVDALVVEHDGQGRVLVAQADRTQEAIFDAPHGQTVSSGKSLSYTSAGLAAPSKHGPAVPRLLSAGANKLGVI
jgi:hypothetical protein